MRGQKDISLTVRVLLVSLSFAGGLFHLTTNQWFPIVMGVTVAFRLAASRIDVVFARVARELTGCARSTNRFVERFSVVLAC